MADQETTDISNVAGISSGEADFTEGDIDQINTPRSRLAATLATGFAVSATGQGGDIPGTFTVATLDGFSALFSPRGAHGGTFTVEHQVRMGPGAAWRTDGSDGTLATDLVTTINHKAFQYRPSLSQQHGAGDATLAVEAVGN